MSLNVTLLGDRVSTEVIKLKWGVGDGREGGALRWQRECTLRTMLALPSTRESWWELITGGKEVWGGENNFLLAGIKCANRATPLEKSIYSPLPTIKSTFLWGKWEYLAESTVSVFKSLSNWARELVSLAVSCHIYKMRTIITVNTVHLLTPHLTTSELIIPQDLRTPDLQLFAWRLSVDPRSSLQLTTNGS